MWSNSIGKAFVVTCFGESHGPGVGVVIDGCPAGLDLSADEIQDALSLRIPQEEGVVSARREPDIVEIFSGTFEGRTSGAPITLQTRNKEANSSDYTLLRDVVRPGHADYPAKLKYGGYSDYRGGGRLSGRMTAAFVAAGAVAQKLLKNFKVESLAYTSSIAGVKLTSPSLEDIRKNTYHNSVRCPNPDTAIQMRETILKAKSEGDSVGGVVECIVVNVPVGVGEPLFDALDAELAKILFGIPAVKGVEYGAGFRASEMRGSENNDQYILDHGGRVVTKTNNSGGILGGMSNGMPILVRVAFKPPSSIAKMQNTINMEKMEETRLEVKGRHDPCVVPKAVPVVQAMVAIGIADLMIRAGMIPRVLKS